MADQQERLDPAKEAEYLETTIVVTQSGRADLSVPAVADLIRRAKLEGLEDAADTLYNHHRASADLVRRMARELEGK